MNKYRIAVIDEGKISYYWKNFNGFIALTNILPTTFPNKKKAKRIMRRLNKYHGNDFFLVPLNKEVKIPKRAILKAKENGEW